MYHFHLHRSMLKSIGRTLFTQLLLLLLISSPLLAQQNTSLERYFNGNVKTVVPQGKSYAPDSTANGVRVKGVKAEIDIAGSTATTTLTTTVQATGGTDALPQSFQLLIPVPQRAELVEAPRSGVETSENLVLLNVSGEEGVATALAGARALKAAEMMEFSGERLILSGPYSIDPNGEQEIRIVYRESLDRHGNRVDYRLPRSESFNYRSTVWSITARVHMPDPIAAIYSPSHPTSIENTTPNESVVTVEASSGGTNGSDARPIDPGDFRLSVIEGKELSGTFFTSIGEQDQQGCLLMVLGAPILPAGSRSSVQREVTLVIDRSGSMQNGKIDQAQQAARNVLKSLREGEAFNIIDYADSVEQFSMVPVLKNDQNMQRALAYIDGIKADGGTNIHDALLDAVSASPTPGYLPLIIFLTDGMPTVGIQDEKSIREDVMKGNVHNRRIFTFGVGYDVNAPLLDAIATDSRASTTFVLPNGSVDESVALLFRKLDGPIFSDISLRVETTLGRDGSAIVSDLLPTKLNDLFEGDYLTLLGHYRPTEPVVFILNGNYLGEKREFRFTFDPVRDRTEEGPFICRLWANRKVMENIDQISRDGAIPESERTEENEEDLRQRTQEIIDLSMANGIVTEYTKDLVVNPNPNSNGVIAAVAYDSLVVLQNTTEKIKSRAQGVRTGKGAANQVMNKSAKSVGKGYANVANTFVDEEMNVVEIREVQQIGDLSFYRRGTRWVEAGALDSAATVAPDRTIGLDSEEYDNLVRQLIAENRVEMLGLQGDILIRRENQVVLVRNGFDLK